MAEVPDHKVTKVATSPIITSLRPLNMEANCFRVTYLINNFTACFKYALVHRVLPNNDLAHIMSSSRALYSIRSASRKGSRTPFCSLLRSKPSADSARTETVIRPAYSARLAIAFQALKI